MSAHEFLIRAPLGGTLTYSLCEFALITLDRHYVQTTLGNVTIMKTQQPQIQTYLTNEI